jgi:hypothetical protein
MQRFSVHIGETTRSIEAPVKPSEPTPVIRDVYWEGNAADTDAAKEAGYRAWDRKYGEGKQPASALIRSRLSTDPALPGQLAQRILNRWRQHALRACVLLLLHDGSSRLDDCSHSPQSQQDRRGERSATSKLLRWARSLSAARDDLSPNLAVLIRVFFAYVEPDQVTRQQPVTLEAQVLTDRAQQAFLST